MSSSTSVQTILEQLGAQATGLLTHECKTISTNSLQLPGPDFVDRVFAQTNRNPQVLKSLQAIYGHGRLAGTGYISILPIDQGIEHTAGASFGKNPLFFDPENIVKLAIDAGCNAVATTFGVLGMMSRKYAHKIPFIVKINHNELLTYPTKYRQIMFGSVDEAWNLGATAVGATIYFGSDDSSNQIIEVAQAFERAHELGMATILWCYLRNGDFVKDGKDYHTAADMASQANHLGATIQADILKQKLPEINHGFDTIGFSKYSKEMYELIGDNPIDWCRYQVMNGYAGRAGLISSGGDAKGATDLAEAVRTAVVNKRAGGTGLILGRKAFQKPYAEAVKIINSVQDVYLDKSVTLA
jgi:class I fructose-bisphosphate aldolase